MHTELSREITRAVEHLRQIECRRLTPNELHKQLAIEALDSALSLLAADTAILRPEDLELTGS